MDHYPQIRTDRLRLRPWKADDRAPFAAMNADSLVMEFFPGRLSAQESNAQVDRFETLFAEHGFGPWVVEIPGVAPFVGFIGLLIPRFEAHFTPCVEIGWRLATDFWNRGYATEGARAVLDFAFSELGLEEVVAMTAVQNVRSRRVMEKLGMIRSPSDDFDHPLVPNGHALQRHVLYRIRPADPAGGDLL
jgi:ribosomal-protein-alanine N-acetyltransferase